MYCNAAWFDMWHWEMTVLPEDYGEPALGDPAKEGTFFIMLDDESTLPRIFFYP